MATLSERFAALTNRSAQTVEAAPVVSYDADPDSLVRKAWQLSTGEWSALTDTERADYRWKLPQAPHFAAVVR